jgi:hypothetical protein
MGEWISVDDRLPEEGRRVLVSDGRSVEWGGLYASYADYDTMMRSFVANIEHKDITHWMPPPPLPTSDETTEATDDEPDGPPSDQR